MAGKNGNGGNGAGADLLMKAFEAIDETRADLRRVDRGLQTVGKYLLRFSKRYRIDIAELRRRVSSLEDESSRH